MNIYQRMHSVMKAVSYVQKEEKKVNNQYTFVSHDAVTAKLRPHLIEAGIVVIPDVKEVKQDGNRTEAFVVVHFVNVEKPEDRVSFTTFGYGIDPQDKGPGKAVSYAVKYALLKAFSLETGDDPEKDNIEHKPKAVIAPATGVWDSMPADEQTFLNDLAGEVRAFIVVRDVQKAVEHLENANLGAEEKIAIWTRFDSSERSAMKKYSNSLKEAK